MGLRSERGRARRALIISMASIVAGVGIGSFVPLTAHAAPQTFYFHGTTADQANRTNSAPTATFSTTAPSGSTDILQTGDDPVANEAVPENPFIIYWEGTALNNVSLTGDLTLDWWWSASPADLALVDAIDINVFADPTGTSGTLISGTSGINQPLTVGTTNAPVENHNTVQVNGTPTSKLLIQVRQHFTNEGTTNTVHYDSTAHPSSFTVGGTTSTPTPTPTATPTPTLSVGGPDTQGSQMFHNYTSPNPPAHTVTSPPGVTFLIGEPSIGSDWITNNILYQGDVSTYSVSFDTAKPPNATWNDRSHIFTSQITLDARLITDHNSASSNRTFVTQLLAGQSAQSYTDNDGGSPPPGNSTSWTASVAGGFPSGPDHESIGAGPYHSGSPFPVPTPIYSNAVYYCAQAEVLNNQQGPIAFCARSDDGGANYGAGVPVYSQTQCGGLHGKPRVGPNGTVYLPNKDCSANATAASAKGLIVSKDNGMNWTVHNIPGTSTDGNQPDPDVAVGGSSGAGTVYYAYRDGDHKAKVVVSTDEGSTWSTPIDVGAAFGIQTAQFPEVIAGDANRAAVTFIGTTSSGTTTGGQGDRTDDVSDNFGCPVGVDTGCGAVWNLYVAFTYDGGNSWQTVNATPNDPVQRGGVCMNGTGCTGNDRNMLDFNDETVDRFGRVHVAYTDGCSGACETDPAAAVCSQGSPTCTSKFSSQFSLVRQTCGLGLFSNNDPGINEDVNCSLLSTNVAESPVGSLLALGGATVAIAAAVFGARRRRKGQRPTP